MLEHAWIGTSEFRDIDHEVDNFGSSMLADRASRAVSDAEASLNDNGKVKCENDVADPKAKTHRPLWSSWHELTLQKVLF